MLLAKIRNPKGIDMIVEVQRIAPVLFDPRPNWVLISYPVDKLLWQRTIRWIHSDETFIHWIREFFKS